MIGPRLGFVGLGWIGAMRLESVAASGRAQVVALCDSVPGRLEALGAAHGAAERFVDYDALLARAEALRLDGVVIATPNALHAAQTVLALEHRLAVFCQKPLALNAAEAHAMVDAARRADRLLAIDYSYRYTDGARALSEMMRRNELGRVFAIDSVFHNAYGPDKRWCYDLAASGGGALMDLGVHEIDLSLWFLDYPYVRSVHGRVFRHGELLSERPGIDDFATARLHLDGGAVVNVSVSWNAHAGRDCVIRTTMFGTSGGAEFRNLDGSFYDFEAVRFNGRTESVLTRESRNWLGRGIQAWVDRLVESPNYDPEIERSVVVMQVIDEIYRQR